MAQAKISITNKTVDLFDRYTTIASNKNNWLAALDLNCIDIDYIDNFQDYYYNIYNLYLNTSFLKEELLKSIKKILQDELSTDSIENFIIFKENILVNY